MPGISMRISRRKLLLVLASALAVLPAMAARRTFAAQPLVEEAQALVQAFADEGLTLLQDRSATPQEQTERFRSLLDKFFAMESIGRWVLGRFWAQLSSTEQQEYLALFEDLIVYGYVRRFGEYTGERFVITRALGDSPTQATVFSEINRPAGGQPIQVAWRVGAHGEILRIVDVVIENVSLSQTWRSDFASTIQQGGGVAALFDSLRQRTADLKKSLGIDR